jgi:hypothetical protein
VQVVSQSQESFDAVVVAIGNYHEPNVVRRPLLISQIGSLVNRQDLLRAALDLSSYKALL